MIMNEEMHVLETIHLQLQHITERLTIRALYFAKKSDRVYRTIIAHPSRKYPVKYLPAFIVGALTDLVSHVKKTVVLVDEAAKKQCFNFKRSLMDVLQKAPYNYILHTVVPGRL